MNLFVHYFMEDPQFFFSWILVITFSICVHEWAHAAAALTCGDDTAARAGHLTLNPLVQMGPQSILFLVLLGIAWGAVPVDVSQLRKRWHEAWVSFAGPLSNLILSCFFCMIAAGVLLWGPADNPVGEVFLLGGMANGVLFLLNMLPVPALDGWTVLAHFFPKMKWVRRETAASVSTMFLLAVFVTPLGGFIWSFGKLISDGFLMVWYGFFRLLPFG
jgi:Zn-dependent protease